MGENSGINYLDMLGMMIITLSFMNTCFGVDNLQMSKENLEINKLKAKDKTQENLLKEMVDLQKQILAELKELNKS